MYSFSNFLRCRWFKTIRWSSKSRRTLPTQRSAMPFCQGLRKAVRTIFVPLCSTVEMTVSRELRVAVKDQKPVWLIVSRLTGHVAVQNLPPVVADDKEAVQ